MKRRHIYFGILCAILSLNIIFAKFVVHQFFYENYVNTLIFCALNILLFPITLFIYKRHKKSEDVKRCIAKHLLTLFLSGTKKGILRRKLSSYCEHFLKNHE